MGNKIIPTKVAGYDIGTIFIAGITKNIEERVLAPIIGNGTIVSGAIKLGAGFIMPKFMGGSKIPKAVALGFAIDGIDDIITGLLGSGGSNGNNLRVL